jgi:hypothetical protein
MTIIFEERLSDSPYIENVTHGWTTDSDSVIRPAENHWHMVLRKYNGDTQLLLVGALPTSGIVSYGEGAELLWIKFKLGTWLSHLPVKEFIDTEKELPNASSQSFWLQGSAWQFPDYNNVETFVDRLVHQEMLVRDPVVNAALEDELPDMSPRTVRHRFMRTTGLTQTYIRQMQRAQQAAALLRQGTSILDTVFETGYFDQPHLTKSLKQFIGYTPAQILGTIQTE